MNKELSEYYSFAEAVPVWEKGMENEMNHSLIFRYCAEDDGEVKIRISADSKYQIFVDSIFYAAGSARTEDGFYTVDEYTLKNELSEKGSVISFIVSGYNVSSFNMNYGPAFFCAEIIKDGEICFATGRNDVEAIKNTSRIKKVQRFSGERAFTESYIYDAYYDGFMTDRFSSFKGAELEKTEEKAFIKSKLPAYEFKHIKPENIVTKGIMFPRKNPPEYKDTAFDSEENKTVKGYKKEELDSCAVNEVLSYNSQVLESDMQEMESLPLGTNCFAVYDMGKECEGYIRLSLTAEHDTVLYAVFTEDLPENGVPEAGKNGCINVIRWAIQGGRPYDFNTFEAYNFRYIQIISMYAPTLITNVSVYEDGCKKKEIAEKEYN